MEKRPQKIVAIVGPTASGKSKLATDLAEQFQGEVLNFDSRQIYCEMDVGTNKTKGVALTDIACPDEIFTVAQFKKIAIKKIDKIVKRKHLPIIAGGTGLYVDAVIYNLKIPDVKPNPALRKKLEKKSLYELQKTLQKLNPEALNAVDLKNKRRIVRTLEVILSGAELKKEKGPKLYDVLILGTKISKEKLKKRIEKRTEKMLELGLEKEVKNLTKKYGFDAPGLNSIGYKEWREYFFENKTLEEVKREIVKSTLQYAKRQMTWWKRNPDIIWIKDKNQAIDEIKKFLLLWKP